jgi:hypothetical protein
MKYRIIIKTFRNTCENDNHGSMPVTVSFRIYFFETRYLIEFIFLFISMVKEIAAGVFCLKVVRYAIYVWLPLYLKQEVH